MAALASPGGQKRSFREAACGDVVTGHEERR